MASSLTPSKRPNDGNSVEPNGKRKLQSSTTATLSKSTWGSPVFRVLCTVAKADIVLGDSSSFLQQVRLEAGCSVRVEDAVPDCEERLIVITSCDGVSDEVSDQNQGNKCEEGNAGKVDGDSKDSGKDGEDKESLNGEDMKGVVGGTSLQKALLLVLDKLAEGEAATEDENGDGNNLPPFIFRLLVLSNEVGCLLGKGGKIINKTRANSGADIRLLPQNELPRFASGSDRVIQISGEVDVVRKAIVTISQQLIKNASRVKEPRSNPSGLSSHSSSNSLPLQESHLTTRHNAAQRGPLFASRPHGVPDFRPHMPPPMSNFHENGLREWMHPSPELLNFRLLCTSDKVGGIIGKGGIVVNNIQQETGCEIHVVEGPPDSENRIIVISGPAHPEERVSPVQHALLLVHNRILRATPDNKEGSVMAQILVTSNHIGCLIGRGGSVMGEMRKSTGAHIRILGKEQIPAFEDEEVVRINGAYNAVQDALLEITNRLKLHFFHDVLPSIDHRPHPALLNPFPSFPTFMRRELSPRILGESGGFHLHDDHPAFMRNMIPPGLPLHMSDRRPWDLEGLKDGNGPLNSPDFPGGPPRRPPGLLGAGQAVITSTTVEVVVPSSVVPSIYGEDGWSLQQICMISDARVTINDVEPGASETTIIISGTPEQTHAAQSLIQAFVMLEHEDT